MLASAPGENHVLPLWALAAALSDQNHAPRKGPHRAWLGAAVSIKEATSIVFPRQSGANLLVVGQQEELALGMLTTCIVGLAATGDFNG
ncbi:MAG: hypothetical protein ACKOYQ_10185, partial [Actinomycetota bacterium]